MKQLIILICAIFSISCSHSQKYLRPVFERSDNYLMHLDSVEQTKDSTILFFTYEAEAGSWANLSDKTYIKDSTTGKILKIQSVSGIPFQPSKRHFTYGCKVPIKASFVSHERLICFDFIEDAEDSSSFNIYGIDLSSHFNRHYTIDEEKRFTNQADFYSTINDSLALQYRLQELEARNFLYGKKSEAASLSLYQLALLYNKVGDNSKAIEYGLQALNNQAIIYGVENKEIPVYPMTLGTLAGIYSDLGDFKKSIQFYEESASLYRRVLGENDHNYAEIRHLLAATYVKTDSIERAISIMREVVYLQKKNLGDMHDNTIMSINNLAGYLEKWGRYVEAIEIREDLAKKLKNDTKKIEMYAQNLHNLAGCYINLFDYDKAIQYSTESLELRKRIYGENSIEYARSLSNLAGYYADSHTEINHAIIICQQSLDIKRRLLGEEDYSLVSTLSTLASLYEHAGDVAKAISITDDALRILKIHNRTETIEYANILCNISLYLQEAGNYQEAIRHGKQVVKIFKDIYGEKHNIYSEHLAYLADLCSKAGDFHSANRYMSEALNVFKTNCSKSLDEMDERWRSLFWNKYHSFFDGEYPYYVFNDMSKENVALLYDNLLFSKGLLVSSRTSSKIDATWKSIQAALHDDEIAIEFATSISTTAKGDSIIITIYALTLKKEHSPRMYKLFNITSDSQGTSEEFQNHLYDNFGDKIWGGLQKELEGVRNIYFSPSSCFNFMAIEYLHTSIFKNIFEQFNLFRLSSTQELIQKRRSNINSNAVLYGGLDYNATENIRKTTNKDRGGYDYLPQTLEEVNEIADLLITGKYDVKIITGNDGTENSFRALSGKAFGIIHLATHSTNISHKDEQEQIKSNNLKFIQPEGNKIPIYEDKAMSRSFILLSGGNQLLQRKVSIDDCDGILTAREISVLDFHNTDLVVLSSCESGTGEMGLDDSMVGLQRGFKKAGANTILMSLHKVDDEATKILMVEFYKNLLSGKSKHQSLKDAQKYLRQVDKGKYDDPKYWAAFILLDGLD